MRIGARKLVLVLHVTSSVGWLGAVASFLALAIVGLCGNDELIVRSVYLAMQSLTSLVIVPLALASLVIGIAQSLTSPWGLVRHRWVLAKLILTTLATLLLLVHTHPIGEAARLAASSTFTPADLGHLRIQLVADSAAALAVLVVNTVLAVYKPWGRTSRPRPSDSPAL